MVQFAANLSMLFTEHPFLDRFEQAAAAGFEAVEFLFPYEHDAERIAGLLERHRLRQVLFNMPPGDWAAGERGMAAVPGREAEFRAHLDTARRYALALGCPRLHAMAGITGGLDPRACEETYVANLRHAADVLAADGVRVLIEPLNDRDMPGYFLSRQSEALRIVERVGRPNVSVQLDLYHAQIMEGDLTRLIERMSGRFDHVQVASVPDRHEPDEGEVNYGHLFAVLDRTGYGGWIGCEYRPRAGTREGLGWLAPHLGAGRGRPSAERRKEAGDRP